MPNTIKTYTQKDIEKIVENKITPFKKEIYIQLNKLRNKQIDLDDIIKVLARK